MKNINNKTSKILISKGKRETREREQASER